MVPRGAPNYGGPQILAGPGLSIGLIRPWFWGKLWINPTRSAAAVQNARTKYCHHKWWRAGYCQANMGNWWLQGWLEVFLVLYIDYLSFVEFSLNILGKYSNSKHLWTHFIVQNWISFHPNSIHQKVTGRSETNLRSQWWTPWRGSCPAGLSAPSGAPRGRSSSHQPSPGGEGELGSWGQAGNLEDVS